MVDMVDVGRPIRLVMKSGEKVDYTVIDYLNLPQPRTSQAAHALKQLVVGHAMMDP
jgi:hypothetical protein